MQERRKARCIFLTGRKGVTELEAAQAIIEEAKSIVQEELGGLGVEWKTPGTADSPPKLKSPVLLSPLGSMSAITLCIYFLSIYSFYSVSKISCRNKCY